MAEPAAPIPQKRPRVPRRVDVVSVKRSSPRWVSVVFRGHDFDGFRIEAPTGHVKIFFPADGETAVPAPAVADGRVVFPNATAQPPVRTYTPRRFDPASGTLEVQFLLHGDGPASRWAERAAVGHRLVIIGPGGRFSLEPDVRRWWIAGDESALPAISTLLEALAPDVDAEVHVEVAGDGDRLDLSSRARLDVRWHLRTAPDAFGAELLHAARAADTSARVRFWVACEASAMREIRRYLLDDRRLPRTSTVTRGYWRLGQTDYPDHDYGED
jgi:NADPH-dependent ferric siderophore reductase